LKKSSIAKDTARHNLFVWLVLVRYEGKVLLACCRWLVCSETKVLLAGKPGEQGLSLALKAVQHGL
jgi:hypothetical protein